VEEARPPRRVARISGFHWRYDESFMLKPLVRVCGLRGMAPWWRSSSCCSCCSEPRHSTQHSVGDNGVVVE
jgi:hypothetical protein